MRDIVDRLGDHLLKRSASLEWDLADAMSEIRSLRRAVQELYGWLVDFDSEPEDGPEGYIADHDARAAAARAGAL